MTMSPDGNIYIAGSAGDFKTTPGAFLPNRPAYPSWPGAGSTTSRDGIARLDPQLRQILAATYFRGSYETYIQALATDPAGNLLIGGGTTPRSLPLLSPLAQGFGGSTTGFVSRLTPDLATLTFSGEFGDNELFTVTGLGIGANGNVLLGGSTGLSDTLPANVWANSISIPSPAALRIDSVVNAASLLTDPVSSGETIIVRGAGFAPGSKLLIGGSPVPTIYQTATAITAVVPSGLKDAATFQIQSGNALSNTVLGAVAPASPGLFSVDGSGVGQAYILNQDGTRNTPDNPAATGERITVFATGVGALTFDGIYAVSQYPATALIGGGYYCQGVAAIEGPVDGFPGAVYQLTVIVPSIPTLTLPVTASVVLQFNGAQSQKGLAISLK
jgi:uncharacterized protein (TIGR03437 family)